MLSLLAIQMKARIVVGGGEEGPLCNPGFELLLLGGSTNEEIFCEDNKLVKWMQKIK